MGLSKASNAYSVASLNAIRSLREAADAHRKIANEAAQVKSAAIDGVGSETWRALWEAARKFSATPYPAQPFPVAPITPAVMVPTLYQLERQRILLNAQISLTHSLAQLAHSTLAKLAHAERIHQQRLGDPATEAP